MMTSAAGRLVESQALDDSLWFMAETVGEAYLQAALRELHAAVEADTEDQCEGGRCSHGFDAGGGEHTIFCDKHARNDA